MVQTAESIVRPPPRVQQAKPTQRIAVVMPAYNEEALIAQSVEAVPDFVPYVIVVDDASTDGTPEVLGGMAREGLIRISHARRRGPGAAVATGITYAVGMDVDVVVTMDADGQMGLTALPHLIQPIVDKEAHYVKGDRLSCKSHRRRVPLLRRLGNRVLTYLSRVATGYSHLGDSQSGYTAMGKEVLTAISWEDIFPGYGYLNDILFQLNAKGFIVKNIPVEPIYADEKSHINPLTYAMSLSFVLCRGFIRRMAGKWRIPQRAL